MVVKGTDNKGSDNKDPDNKRRDNGRPVWQAADGKTNRRLGPDTSAMVDYLLNPPEGYLAPGDRADWGEMNRERVMALRRDAFEALIKAAFETDDPKQPPSQSATRAQVAS